MKKKYYIGCDIGGTSVKLAIIKEDGVIFDKWEIPTNSMNNGESIPKDISNSIKEKMKNHAISIEEINGIGAGAPGYVDVPNGIVIEAVNIGWKDYHLKKELEELLHVPVFVLNDANLAALGENWLGAGQGSDNLIAVTLGTGVGGGIVVNGEVINGSNGTGGEIGHIIVTPNEGYLCNCGRKGCIETYASATGFVKQGLEAIENGLETTLSETLQLSGKLTSKDIFEHAKNGDNVSKQIIEKNADLLGLMLANLAVTTDPDKIIIGGGVAKAGNQLLTPLKAAFSKFVLGKINETCEIFIAQLGNDAGVVGGAYYVKQQLQK
ncbi:glucokinase [Salirhabdus euzebyi]|uniref:Glucokinase n=1 Tax=Salirhabdus euzebyi TaxID=394506 RepID=A0A841Q6V4_9BACI|nr:ROK family glucokinase [Salirhabdus euzebyi]MBB6454269.1 glucokinase [Salirhabdus euzebyi]